MKSLPVIVLLLPPLAIAEVPVQPAFVPRRTPVTHRVSTKSANEELAAQNPELKRMMQDPEGYRREVLERVEAMRKSLSGETDGREKGDPAKALQDGRLEKAAAGKLTPEQLKEMKKGLQEAIRMQKTLQLKLQRQRTESESK